MAAATSVVTRVKVTESGRSAAFATPLPLPPADAPLWRLHDDVLAMVEGPPVADAPAAHGSGAGEESHMLLLPQLLHPLLESFVGDTHDATTDRVAASCDAKPRTRGKSVGASQREKEGGGAAAIPAERPSW